MGVVDLGKIRGTMWYAGTAIDGTSSAPVVFENSGISYAYADDLYCNSDNGNIYVCIAPGAADTATWSYIGCIEGPQPPLINNLTTASTTMALTAKMGKTLNDKINNAGLYPYEIIPMLTEPSYLLRMVIEDIGTTITIKGEGDEEGTYEVSPLGVSDRQTVTIPLNSTIGFSEYGAVIRDIVSSDAAIFSYILFDEETQEQCNVDLKLWDALLDQIGNISRKGVIAEGTTNYLTAEVSQVLDGERKALFPITHDGAVWHNKADNVTVHDKLVSLISDLNTLATSLGARATALETTTADHETRLDTVEDTLDGVPEQIAEVQSNVNTLQAKILDDLDDVCAATEEGFISGALALKQLNSNLTDILSYKTSEIETGQTWKGKKLYRQVVECTGATVRGTDTQIALITIPNLETVMVDLGHSFLKYGAVFAPLNYWFGSCGIILITGKNSVAIHNYIDNTSWLGSPITVTIEYTKTTD